MALAATPSSGRAQTTAQLVRDIHTGLDTLAAGSDPAPARPVAQNAGQRYFVQQGGATYFTARTASAGTELWRTFGPATTTQMLADVFPGRGSSDPRELAFVGAQLFFAADNGVTGTELWVWDTTGARLVKDIRPGPDGASPSSLCALGTKLLFSADDGANGPELWISDGTAQGTMLVADILAGAAGSAPANLTASPNATFVMFAAASSPGNTELWRSDGTAQGTSLVAEIHASGASNPAFFNPLGSRIVFQANDGASGIELWATDGTAQGTSRVADVRPGTAGGTSLVDAIVLGGRLLFQGQNGSSGPEPWVTDGTPAGTFMLADVNPGSNGAGFTYPALHGGKVYFACRPSTAGYEIWESDGTTANTKKTLGPLATSAPQWLASSGNLLYFSLTGPLGLEPWVSDLTANGTKLLLDINAGGAGSTPRYFTLAFGTTILFSADDGKSGFELWTSDGTAQGTTIIDINQPALPPTLGSDASQIVDFFGQLVLLANDGANGAELWTSDGTAAGTRLLKDIHPTGSGGPSAFALLGDKLLFRANDGTTGFELWITDGTAAGTSLVMDISPGIAAGNPNNITRLGNRVYFSAMDGSNGIELWTSDGTAFGTQLVKDINTRSAIAGGVPRDFVELDRTRFLFRANDGTNGAELWISDGTTAGTQLLRDIRPGSAASTPSEMTRLGNRVLFRADDGSAGAELWISDGTAAGTQLVRDIYPGVSSANVPNSSSPAYFAELGGKLYFAADDGISGVEIWETDGTAAGTKLAIDLVQGPVSSSPSYLTRAGSRHIWFAAGRYPVGTEIWRTDGTLAGSQLVLDINPGNASSNPNNQSEPSHAPFAVSRGRVYFQADDGTRGTELWVATNGATAQPFGQTCGTTTLTASDPILGKLGSIAGTTTVPSPLSVVVFGVPAARPLAVGNGCWSYVDLSVFLPLQVTTSASWSLPLPIPNDPALAGVSAALQTWCFPSATFPVGLELSNGVLLTAGL